MTEEEEKHDPELQILEGTCMRLMEHFDSVRIFVTKHDARAQETSQMTVGRGNLFAQLGQVDVWRVRQDEIVRDGLRKED